MFIKPDRFVECVHIHCSASDRPEHDNVDVIRDWHLQRGFSDIGYHFFISKDGAVHKGRDLEEIPASARGFNTGSLAICLHGLEEDLFTGAQFNSLRDLCKQIDDAYFNTMVFKGHTEMDPGKTCPVFDYRTVLGLDPSGMMTLAFADPVVKSVSTEDDFENLPTLMLTSRGKAVEKLQELLGIVDDGIFWARHPYRCCQLPESQRVGG